MCSCLEKPSLDRVWCKDKGFLATNYDLSVSRALSGVQHALASFRGWTQPGTALDEVVVSANALKGRGPIITAIFPRWPWTEAQRSHCSAFLRMLEEMFKEGVEPCV